jgi:hypothetical protein
MGMVKKKKKNFIDLKKLIKSIRIVIIMILFIEL